jgi:hypothetical protein
LKHWQEPFWQVVPEPQRALHTPQLLPFVSRSTQEVPHWVVPAGHWHAPPEQVIPAPQVTPHPPQLAG